MKRVKFGRVTLGGADGGASLPDRIRAVVGEALESGVRSPLAEPLSRAWARVAAKGVRRPVALPDGLEVIGVGSAVLGGAGKTPLVVALARALAARGEHVAVVGHAYRARPGRARRVQPSDDVREVGDDALFAATALSDVPVAVFVAPDRGDALAMARATGARVALVDGLLQATPAPLAASVLVLDAERPWGAGACPPSGDLRADPPVLLSVADHVVALAARGGTPVSADLPAEALMLETSAISAIARDGARAAIAAFANRSVGVVSAIARPGRLIATLARAGVHPRTTAHLADHAQLQLFEHLAPGGVEAWLTTSRDAVNLPAALAGAPVFGLELAIDVSPLLSRLRDPGDVQLEKFAARY